MPSLPTSLIVVGLVVAWLVVLVPMVAKRREQVPENTDEGANFHVLQRNSKSRRRPLLSRTAMAHRSRGDAGEYDGALGEASDDDAARKPGSIAGVEGEAGRVADAAQPGERVGDTAETAVAARRDRSRVDGEPGDGTIGTSAQRAGYDAGYDPGYDAARGAAALRIETGREDRRSERASVGEPRPASDDADYRRTPLRQGRGGFDPAAADRTRAYRFRRRQRVALLLLAVAAMGGVVGFLGTGYGYAASVTSGVLLVLYLAYLRRQVRIENEIRLRRAARLARARQIRPGYRPSVAEQVYAHRTGEIPRPGEVEEYRVSSHARQTVPPSGYGYGEPVDFEDSDPAFDDLEYYRPAAFRRRAG